MSTTQPAARPANPRFSSGPCAKPPAFSLEKLADAPLGRSHRAAEGKAKLLAAIETTRAVLGVPDAYRVVALQERQMGDLFEVGSVGGRS